MIDERIPGWDAPLWCSLADCDVKCACRPGDIVAICQQHNADGEANTVWLNIRKGLVGASSVHKLIGIKGQPSKSATRETYKYELVAEQITGQATEHHCTHAMKRGIELEPEARDWYATTHRPVREVGFVRPDGAMYGCSPDGLCEDRGMEIKCRMPPAHCRILDTGTIPVEDRLQMQFGMWVTGLPLWDYVLYAPPGSLPCWVSTVEADHELHAAFETVLADFCAEVSAAVDKIRG